MSFASHPCTDKPSHRPPKNLTKAPFLPRFLLLVLTLTACQSAPSPPEPAPTPSETSPPSGPPEPRPASTPSGKEVSAPNLHNVEVLDLVNQAVEMARQLNPAAVLVDVNASGLTNGTLNLLSRESGPTPTMVASFEYKTRDPTSPPGNDTREGSLKIGLRKGRLIASPGLPTAIHLRFAGPVRQLPCPVSKAWRSVVATGMPENANARVALWRSPGSSDEWLFSVEGHDEYRRVVSATTCSTKVVTKPKTSPTIKFPLPSRTPFPVPHAR